MRGQPQTYLLTSDAVSSGCALLLGPGDPGRRTGSGASAAGACALLSRALPGKRGTRRKLRAGVYGIVFGACRSSRSMEYAWTGSGVARARAA